MIVILSGASHTGKTKLAQTLLQRYHFPYLSIDHLKMGLIRSGQTTLNPCSPDEELTAYLWPIVREMIKTAVENRQNLIVEGCYVPFDWKKDFEPEYLTQIRAVWLVMTERYLTQHFDRVKAHASDIEARLEDDIALEELIADNAKNYDGCKTYGCERILIDEDYAVDLTL